MTFHITHDEGIFVSVVVPTDDINLAKETLGNEGYRCGKTCEIDGIETMRRFDVMKESQNGLLDVDRLKQTLTDAGFQFRD